MRGQRDTRPALTTPQLLVAALKNDNMLWRMHAQRLLVTRGQKDVVPALSELVRDKSVDEISLNPAAIHALWTLHGLGALDGSDSHADDAALAADEFRHLDGPRAGQGRRGEAPGEPPQAVGAAAEVERGVGAVEQAEPNRHLGG